MQKVVIVTDYCNAVHKEIERNLREVFGDLVDYGHIYLDSLKPGVKISGDVALFMLPNRVERCRTILDDQCRPLVVSKTIKEDSAFRLLDIPEGSEVLIVNDCIENALDTVTLMYQLKIKGLKSIPYELGMDISRFKISVTPGAVDYVPDGIAKVIDVGDRCLDGETMIKLMNILKMSNQEVNKNLLAYINSTADLMGGIRSQYRRTRLREAQLNTILNMAHEGFILISKDNTILMHNEFVSTVLGWEIRDSYTQLETLLKGTALAGRSSFTEELVEINNKWLLVTRENVEDVASDNQTMIVFQDVTRIRQLENNIWEKTKLMGQHATYSFEDIVSQSKKMTQCILKAKRFSENDLTILIQGESGTGKEMLAQSIHNLSARCKAPFVAVNCAALPESLLESELFGYEAGAFTGARKDGKRGLFEQAHKGTIFLDEIGDMPALLQSRLLRVIQEKQIMRIGSDKVIAIDVRVISATNKSLKSEVDKNHFRKDLYFRLNVLPLIVPPLRDRKDDILLLFNRFLDDDEIIVSLELRQILMAHHWEGNVRELENFANYYKLMRNTDEPYPSYIKSKHESPYDEDLMLLSLEICYEASLNDQTIGRKRLKELIEDHIGNPISEYQVRKILKTAVDNELLIIHRGRRGCCLTEDGIKLIT